MKDKVGYAIFCLGFIGLSILAFLISFMTPMSPDSLFAWHSEEALGGIRVFIFAIQEVAYFLFMSNILPGGKKL